MFSLFMNAFTIKDIENLSGIKAHTIRIWELRYSLLNPHRTDTNIRYYSNEELQKILNIALLNKYGYKISHIDRMTLDEMSEKIMALTQDNAQEERIMNELIKYMAIVKMEAFEKVLDSCILAKGIEKTILQIIFPFLERIGILWITNHINPAQEHLVVNIIRQKLIVGIDQLKTPTLPNKTLLLFLPEGEYHELGLLFMHFLLKSRGNKVVYLGSNVPIKDVAYVAEIKNPDYLFTHLTSVSPNFKMEKFISNFQSRMPNRQIVASGGLTKRYKNEIPDNFSFKKSIPEILSFISSL